MKNNKKIIVIPGNLSNLDTYLATKVVLDIAKNTYNKQVEIVLPASGIPMNFNANLPFPEIAKHSKLPSRTYSLQFKKQADNKIKQIQWQQSEGQTNVFITMEKGTFNSGNVEVNQVNGDYDLMILVGVPSLESLGEIYTTSGLFNEIPVVSLTPDAQMTLASLQNKDDKQSVTVCELTYMYLIEQHCDINKDQLNQLLAGIYSATRNFTERVKTAKTFENVAKILRQGAQIEAANLVISDIKKQPQTPSVQEPAKQPEQQANGEQNPVTATTKQ